MIDCQKELIELIGDGYCHDYTNNLHCGFDHGDCCGSSCVNTDYCEKCICKTGKVKGIVNALVGDGYCHDETNTEECNFDGGDCCGPCRVTQYPKCKACECLTDEVSDEVGISNVLVGNGYCNTETNNPLCNFDNLECCGAHLRTKFCSDTGCECKGKYFIYLKLSIILLMKNITNFLR